MVINALAKTTANDRLNTRGDCKTLDLLEREREQESAQITVCGAKGIKVVFVESSAKCF